MAHLFIIFCLLLSNVYAETSNSSVEMQDFLIDIEKKIDNSEKKNISQKVKIFLKKKINNANELIQKIKEEEAKKETNNKKIKNLVKEFENEKKDILEKMYKISPKKSPPGYLAPRYSSSFHAGGINCPKWSKKKNKAIDYFDEAE